MFQSSGGALQRLKQLVPVAGTKVMQVLSHAPPALHCTLYHPVHQQL